jgi:ribosome biogenesis GTPase A
LLRQRFELDELPESGLETMELIGSRRGCLRGGGRVDLERTSKIILTEIRSGMLGQISWELPAMTEKEWAEVLVVREQKAAKKAERKQKRRRR